MQSVPRAAGVLIAAAVLGCGGAPSPSPRHARVDAKPARIGGASLQSARCSDWRAGTGAQRRAIVRALTATVGGPSGAARGTTLPADVAQRMLDHKCASPIARHFLLYELYTRAAGFSSLAPPAE